jgi:PIN domain nuclease of toxin-antitoxin system
VSPILLDTHAWAWSLQESVRLGPSARDAIAAAENRFVSPISLYEIGQKVRLGRWPEMAPFLPRLARLAVEQGNRMAALTADVCLAAATLNWSHRDPFDRIIAATCLAEGLMLVSGDSVFDGLAATGRLTRIW